MSLFESEPLFSILLSTNLAINLHRMKKNKKKNKTIANRHDARILKEATCQRGPGDWDHDSSREKDKTKKKEVSVSFGIFCAKWSCDPWHSAEGLVLTMLPSLPVFICPDIRTSAQPKLIWGYTLHNRNKSPLQSLTSYLVSKEKKKKTHAPKLNWEKKNKNSKRLCVIIFGMLLASRGNSEVIMQWSSHINLKVKKKLQHCQHLHLL